MADHVLLSLAGVLLMKILLSTAVVSATAGDVLHVRERLVADNATEIVLADARNTNQPILLSGGGAYAWQFFPVTYGEGTSQRLLVVLSTLFNTTILWMANRNHPVSSNATLVILRHPSSRLVLRDGNGTVVWSPSATNISSITMNNTGNLYILDDESTNPQWQSFDDLSDTILTGQRLRVNHTITASLSWDDWSSGHYMLREEPGGIVFYASFDAQQNMVPYALQNYVEANTSLASALHSACNHTDIIYNEDFSGFTLAQEGAASPQCLKEQNYIPKTRGFIFTSRFSGEGFRFARLTPDGDITSFFISNSTGFQLDSQLLVGHYGTSCKLPSYCGVNALCSAVQTCSCPQLFEAIDPNDATQGCRLQTPLNCSISMEHQFLQVQGSDYFANQYHPPRSFADKAEDCTNLCLQNCSCTAAFHNNETGACYLYEQVRTIDYLSNPSVNAFLRVSSLPAVPGEGGNASSSRWVIIGVSIGSSVLAIILVGLLTWIWRKRLEGNEESDTEEEAFLGALPRLPPRFTYAALEKATEGFSKTLGSGASGAVYEGFLDFHSAAARTRAQHDLVRVAVKKLTTSSCTITIGNASKTQFRAEVATLGNINHVNLIQLKGFCAEGPHRILIYEFAENGSLDKWIFPRQNMGSPRAEAIVLPWDVRYKIAVDTAKGLAFLHEECRDKVVHFDVKPQNILLNAKFRAKIADFGLSKLMATHQGSIEQSMMAMRGTPGYMAPEWFYNLPITEKSDVFSYGMVLLELVGGRKNLNTAAETIDNWYLPAWAVKQAKGGAILDVVDNRLMDYLSSQPHEERDRALTKMKRLINVAFWCIQVDASTRPTMTTVVLMLEEYLQVPDPPLGTTYAAFTCSSSSSKHSVWLHSRATPEDHIPPPYALSNSSDAKSCAVEMDSMLSPR
ncbi:hypothetical protein KP509_24G031800 [Ceratopteris richardii]|uniref:Receptor-like serine/threonine-protein kinase n=1 Tax=Ceratopteris richardii TaxID=49495 RepID=A0A8T2RUB2_CERRI|nr:hypothetical protein KP509_24G031800 [Ceratopteris richardii]